MSRGSVDSLHAVESCAFKLFNWRPFAKSLDSDHAAGPGGGPHSKRPCRADRATSSFSIDAILDMSKLTLFDDDRALSLSAARKRWLARKRRRRAGSRSVSGRSSDRRGGCSVGASGANGTCSDLPMATGGTDSSGELFGDSNWASDVSDRNSRRGREGSGGGERENLGGGCGQFGNLDNQGTESGYGSEPGYRGDAELGYGDEEEDDSKVLFWGDEFGDASSKMEKVGKNSLQKAHHRCRRKKHDVKMVDTLR
ncbi:K-box region and MADS-box transcription factor family protein [Striga asiatica]|uniref:K-box region and MADS-box transcription factor family protein n=1 Tax=Striga asiatica TaxID=4170 RepID=A0A5A7NW57_STRAF|nr:K-box region and MADS-box transcription factor family protein [Striga asiatica]